MPQAVKLPDRLIDDARAAAERESRSLAGQIDYWARLGQAVEGQLQDAGLRSLKEPTQPAADGYGVADAIAATLTPDWQHELAASLRTQPGYGTDPAFPGWLVRFEPDGRKAPGRLEARRFVPLEPVPRGHAAV